jgi:hypothetical protein
VFSPHWTEAPTDTDRTAARLGEVRDGIRHTTTETRRRWLFLDLDGELAPVADDWAAREAPLH